MIKGNIYLHDYQVEKLNKMANDWGVSKSEAFWRIFDSGAKSIRKKIAEGRFKTTKTS